MGFLFPGFWWGLLALAVPVVIHLLELRRPQRLRFSNTGAIRAVELVANRQRKVRHWAVLAARVLGLAALVAVFCQPFWAGSAVPDRPTGTVGVLVDASPSLGARGTDGRPLLDAAREQAAALVRGYGGATRFRLAGRAAPYTTETARQALDGLRVSAQRSGREALPEPSGPAGNGPNYVFSDFQKTALPAAQLRQLRELSQAGPGRTVLVPLAAAPQGNVYVDSLWLDDAFVRPNTSITLHLRLRNGGAVAVPQCPVKVFVGQRQAAALEATVAAGAQVDLTLQVQVPDNQTALCRATTGDAPVTFDNAFYFVLQPAAAIRVLEIGAAPLLRAVYANEPLFAYSFATAGGVDYGALRTANLVLLRELPTISAGLREALAAATKRGASVVVVPGGGGGAAGHAAYQSLFRALGAGEAQWEPTAAAGAGSGSIPGSAPAPEQRELALPGPQDGFFRDVLGAQPRAVAMPRAAPVLRWARTGADILRFADGESYLAEFGSGAGRAYVFAAPFGAAYSDFSSHALFVPVLYKLALRSYRRAQLPAYRLTQAALTLELPEAVGAAGATDRAPLRLVRGATVLVPGQRALGGQLRLEVPPGMAEPGFYQLKNGDQVLTTLAFNADRKESELAAYSAAELRALAGPGVQVLEAGAGGAALAQLRAEEAGRPLWRYFLVLALACLLAEAALLRLGK